MFRNFSAALLLAAVAGQVSANTLSEDDQWACEIALCMGNPSGPTALAECKPPIEKMLREQAKGHTIPTCPFTQSGGGGGGAGSVGGGGGTKDPHVQQQQE